LQGLITRGALDASTFDVTRLFHPAWHDATHKDEARKGARLNLSMFRPPRRAAPSGDAPTETRSEQVQAIVSEARVAAHAVAHDPELLLLLRRSLASIYRQGVGLSTDEFGRVELVRPLAGTTERAQQAAGVANAPTGAGNRGRGRSGRFLSSGESRGSSKRGRRGH
jgi:hypothetical protein